MKYLKTYEINVQVRTSLEEEELRERIMTLLQTEDMSARLVSYNDEEPGGIEVPRLGGDAIEYDGEIWNIVGLGSAKCYTKEEIDQADEEAKKLEKINYE